MSATVKPLRMNETLEAAVPAAIENKTAARIEKPLAAAPVPAAGRIREWAGAALRMIAPPALGLFLFIGLGALIAQDGRIPGPGATWTSAAELFADPFYNNGPNDQGIGWNILNSLERVGLGFGMAALIGIPLGFIVGRFKFFADMTSPIISLLRPVSPLAWLPIGLYVFKDTEPASLWVIFISSILLEGENMSANLGAMKGWDGKLRLGLQEKTAPFHLELSAQASAPELQSVLLQLTRDEKIHGELAKVRDLEGELSGRLLLGESLDAITPVVTILKAQISATYDPIPFPVAIRGARFYYDSRIIRLENLEGSVGRPSLAGLSGTLRRDGSRQINVESERVSLDLQQTETWLRAFEAFRPRLEKWLAARGQVELENLTLSGIYDVPAGWSFASRGRIHQVEIAHADLPGRFRLSRGTFNARQGTVGFSDAVVEMSDAALTTGGTFEYRQRGVYPFDIGGSGTIGPQMTEWLSRHAELPETLRLRSPLDITAGRLARRADGAVSFRGQVTVAGGPQLSLEAGKEPQLLALRNLAIEDGSRRAQMTFQLAKDKLDLPRPRGR